MKIWIARLSILLIGIILGGAIGISALLYYGLNRPEKLLGMYAVKYIVWELEATQKALKSGDRGTAIHALEHSTEMLEFFSNVEGINEWGAPTDLAMNHIRLGMLYEDDGDMEKAKLHYGRGTQLWNSREKGTRSLADLKEFVKKIDLKASEENYEVIGNFKNIFDKHIFGGGSKSEQLPNKPPS